MKKYLQSDMNKRLYHCRPCGINYNSISIHAEEIALNNYIRSTNKKDLNRGFTIFTFRISKNQNTKIYEYANSKPCSKCICKSIPSILKNNNINPNKIRCVYTTKKGIIITTFNNLKKEPLYFTSGSSKYRKK
jgi:hypothetical protein